MILKGAGRDFESPEWVAPGGEVNGPTCVWYAWIRSRMEFNSINGSTRGPEAWTHCWVLARSSANFQRPLRRNFCMLHTWTESRRGKWNSIAYVNTSLRAIKRKNLYWNFRNQIFQASSVPGLSGKTSKLIEGGYSPHFSYFIARDEKERSPIPDPPSIHGSSPIQIFFKKTGPKLTSPILWHPLSPFSAINSILKTIITSLVQKENLSQ